LLDLSENKFCGLLVFLSYLHISNQPSQKTNHSPILKSLSSFKDSWGIQSSYRRKIPLGAKQRELEEEKKVSPYFIQTTNSWQSLIYFRI
jgi:hypothetical protein